MALGSVRAPLRLLALVLAVAAAGSACGGPKYHYVKNSSERSFLRVPHHWTLFDEDELLTTSDESPERKALFKRISWSVAFDGAPKPSLQHVLSPSPHPSGLLQVRQLMPDQRDTFALADLRSLILNFDPLSREAQEEGGVEVLGARDVDMPGGFHGSELLLNLQDSEGEFVKWRQVAMVDSKVERVHVLVLTCDAKCYAANESTIDKIVESWKLRERS